MAACFAWCYFLVLLTGFFLGAHACTVPTNVRGSWELSGGGTTSTIQVTSSSLTGLTIWDRTLNYNCFLQMGNYYVYSSEEMILFDDYNVTLYFCWYLQAQASGFKLYELTNKVLETVDDRAKAYLTNGGPTINEVCETAFSTNLPYKAMEAAASTGT